MTVYLVWRTAGRERRASAASIAGSLFALAAGTLICSVLLATGWLMDLVERFVFFPDLTSDFLQVQLEMAEGTPAAKSHDALRRVQQGLWEVDRQLSEEQGVESGAVVTSVMAFATGDTSGQIITELVKENDDVITGPEVLRRWREAVGTIPGVKTLAFEGATGPGGGPSISLQLIGTNIEQVGRLGEQQPVVARKLLGEAIDGGNEVGLLLR